MHCALCLLNRHGSWSQLQVASSHADCAVVILTAQVFYVNMILNAVGVLENVMIMSLFYISN